MGAAFPVWSHDGIICTGETYKTVVKLTFAKGASLEDPAGLFNASLEGNVRRAIDLGEGNEMDRSAFIALVPPGHRPQHRRQAEAQARHQAEARRQAKGCRQAEARRQGEAEARCEGEAEAREENKVLRPRTLRPGHVDLQLEAIALVAPRDGDVAADAGVAAFGPGEAREVRLDAEAGAAGLQRRHAEDFAREVVDGRRGPGVAAAVAAVPVLLEERVAPPSTNIGSQRSRMLETIAVAAAGGRRAAVGLADERLARTPLAAPRRSGVYGAHEAACSSTEALGVRHVVQHAVPALARRDARRDHRGVRLLRDASHRAGQQRIDVDAPRVVPQPVRGGGGERRARASDRRGRRACRWSASAAAWPSACTSSALSDAARARPPPPSR